MVIKEDYSLKPYNTFGIDVNARYYLELTTTEQIQDFVNRHFPVYDKIMILGEGSNILFTRDYDGIVLRMNNKGIQLVREDKDHFYLKANAGEVWDDFVNYCIGHQYAGLENLSLIPGLVGASPIQNIGAYGVELKDHFEELEAINLENGQIELFDKSDCVFGYRDSVFKKDKKGKYIILSVTFRLDKLPVFKTKYGVIEQELKEMGVLSLSIEKVNEAVCRIRRKKLPDPKYLGNAGSFFKNPVVTRDIYEELINVFPGLVAFTQAKNSYKLAAAWLVEQCGWKGKRIGNTGVYEHQSLVLVNHGSATGQQILELSMKIQETVHNKFGINLEREINVI